MLDYQEIIDNLEVDKVIQLMVSLGADRYVEKDGYVQFPTICHNDDSSSASLKLYFYKDTKLFICYTECGNMSIFSFLKHYYEARGIEYDWYQDILEVVNSCSIDKSLEDFQRVKYKSLQERYQTRKVRKELTSYPKGILDVFIKHYPIEWESDGISRTAMDKFNILYSISQNKIIIPHYDVDDNLIGIRGRALDVWEVENIGKYMPVQIEQKWYSHPLSLNLYGLNVNKENIKKTGVCYLFEAEKSALSTFPLISGVVIAANGQLNRKVKVVREPKS